MSISIKKLNRETDLALWDSYVSKHPESTLYHLSGWKNVIEKTYGHKTYYLIAIENATNSTNPTNPSNDNIIGILPLVHLKHFLFGNSLISIPFFDLGGILADDEKVEKALIPEAINLGHRLKVTNIELRHQSPLSWLNQNNSNNPINSSDPTNPINTSNPTNPINSTNTGTLPSAPRTLRYATRSHKVRMLLELPESSDELMKSFKSKLRSQIKKPIKEGLTSKVGSIELLDDFYKVFLINMRDLGSPVHSKKIIKSVLNEFPEKSKIIIIYKDNEPVACSMAVGFKEILENPWASSLREYSRLSPNMLLYWKMLEYACDNGYKFFDFGRSSPDEGTYKFKEQWGANPTQLHWQYILFNSNHINENKSDKSKFARAIDYWQKLPVWVTKIFGPRIRKHIGL